ncbi:MAG: hypothetical protein HY901_13550 [Deltaproteobacteria bacterium]|nr:hypothetical protein [Deltaproteobacteria bacterium]
MLRTLAIIAVALSLEGFAHAAGLPQLRGDVATADSRVASARSQRMDLQRSLDEVARQIEALKAQQGNALFRDSQLDGLLKTSQDLSSRMTDALRAENDAAEALRGGQAKLVNELDGELARLRARWDAATTREERAGLVQQLKGLRAELDSLRRAMPSTLVPKVSDSDSDDPEELLERADALLDGEDKLRREEKALEKRIAELKSERDLERRMNEFLGEEALFDEHDRRLSITRPGRSLAADASAAPGTASVDSQKTAGDAPATGATPSPSWEMSDEPSAVDGRTAPPTGYSSNEAAPGGSKVGSSRGGASFGQQDGAEVVAAPRVGVTRTPPERRFGLAPYSDDESLEELVARREELRKVADDMHRKANEAASKARDLR